MLLTVVKKEFVNKEYVFVKMDLLEKIVKLAVVSTLVVDMESVIKELVNASKDGKEQIVQIETL